MAIGITTHDGVAQTRSDDKTGCMACWENFHENGELGTGGIVPGATFHVVKSATPDASHIWAFTKTGVDGRIAWQAGYGWSKAGVITSFDTWMDYLGKATNATPQPEISK